MRIKQHLSGTAIAYQPIRKRTEGDAQPGRPQGSLYNKQKRMIADAVEWMRRYGRHRPLIFVLTSPGFTDLANEGPLISRFTNALRMRHGLEHYVWVRELTGNGFPHFHFVATIPRFDAVRMSLVWSGYFGSTAKNSIRLGSYPKNGRRQYYVNSQRMAHYMSKYIGKGVGNAERVSGRRVRAFQISQELKKVSEPCIYEDRVVETSQGYHERVWDCIEANDWIETEGYIKTNRYRWVQPNELHNVFIGTSKKIQKKR